MTDYFYHVRLAKEQRKGALREYEERRYSVVGHLSLIAAEQAIEALASREGKHFHERPRDAHSRRSEWLRNRFPSLASDLEALWSIRGELGYGGVDGDRAKEAIGAMERIFDVLRI